MCAKCVQQPTVGRGGRTKEVINRQKTDEGTTVSTSLLANGIWSNSVLIQSILAGNPPVESFHWDELSALRNIYFTKDNVLFFLMVLNEEKHWELLLDRLNIGELARDERFENAEARNSNKGLLMTILQDRLSELECAQIETVLQDTGIIFSRVSSAQQTISDLNK